LLPNERLNSELGRQIQDAAAGEASNDGFRVWQNIFFRGQLLKHGGFANQSSIRLFRKNAVQYELRNGRAEALLESKKVGALNSRLSAELCLGLERSVSEVMRLAKSSAENAWHLERRPTRRRAFGQASWQLVQSYFLRMGWLDGWAGLHASFLAGFATYLREAMLWELTQPAAPQYVVVRDSWQGLKLFDPTTTDSLPAPPTEADDRSEARPLRHAA
jgi:hypothetical protein